MGLVRIASSYHHNSSTSQEIEGFSLHYSSASVKKTCFNRHYDIAWPLQCHNFASTAGAGGFTAEAAAPAVNMLEETMRHTMRENDIRVKSDTTHPTLPYGKWMYENNVGRRNEEMKNSKAENCGHWTKT